MGQIRLEGKKTEKKTELRHVGNRLLTFSFSSLSDCLCPSHPGTIRLPMSFSLSIFRSSIKMATQSFRNSPCWSESSSGLNCIINYSTDSGLEANLKSKRNKEGARVRWGDGGQLS